MSDIATASPELVPEWGHRDSLPTISPVAGVDMGVVVGGAMMMGIVTLAPGAIVPLHQHPNEQLGYVLEGIITLTVGGETHDLGPGSTYLIPGGTPHEGSSVDGCVVIDVFSPPRPDYAELARAASLDVSG